MNITSLTVAPAFQRRGIARALLSEVLQRHGAGPLAVQTGAKNAAALHIYERIGFIAVRRWVVGPEVLEVVRLLRLPPGAAKSAAYAV
jgi:GNAT superfamily N-acetyltransferase